VLNWWLTHAMSFNVMKGMCYSVIHWVISTDLVPCLNDTDLLCHKHYIVHLWWWHPTGRMLQMKKDCKAAYNACTSILEWLFRPFY
jgi:hypothetical protein